MRMKRSDMTVTVKTTLAKKNSEMEKLEKSKRSHLRMLTSSGAKLRIKQAVVDEVLQPYGDVEAKNIRMYETHVPGFCYLRNGECRKRTTSITSSSILDPIQCSEKVKAILFTDNELDVQKTMCLHLLATHVQTRAHIQRKDGRLCSYVKAQTMGTVPHTLQPYSQRAGANANKAISKYDKMLPRYILDVKMLCRGLSTLSMKACEIDSGSDEEAKKKRRLQVPIYINNEIRMIIQSVMEALEAVNSPKLKELINLASSPEELRHMLTNEDLQDFIVELSTNPLVIKPTSYDFIMTHLMFDKIPEKGTLESVAQVLEIYDNTDLQKSLSQIQRAILQRHKELVNSNIIPRNKSGILDKTLAETFKSSNPTVSFGAKYTEIPSTNTNKKGQKENVQSPKSPKSLGTPKKEMKSKKKNEEDLKNTGESQSVQEEIQKPNSTNKTPSKSVSINLGSALSEENNYSNNDLDYDETAMGDESRENDSLSQSRSSSIHSNKFSFQNLSNPQRILIGLKVASLKSKPINMHQFEGKKKIDLAAILAPIINSQDSDGDLSKHSLENHLSSYAVPDRKAKKLSSNISDIHTNDLENLTRALLANLRLEISESENKRRVSQFMATLS